MRVLFSTTPLDGHFRPLLPLARALEARGHEVAFATAASWHANVEVEGFDALAAGADHTAARRVRLDGGWDAIQELPALDRRPYVFSYLFAQGHAPLKLPAAARRGACVARARRSCTRAATSRRRSPPPRSRLPSVNHGFGTMVSLSILERAAPAVAPLWRSRGSGAGPIRGRVRGPVRGRRPAVARGRAAAGAEHPAAARRAASRSIHRRGSSSCHARSSTRPWARSSTGPSPSRRSSKGSLPRASARSSPSAATWIRPRSATCRATRPGRAVRAAGGGARLLRGRRLARRLGHAARRARRGAAARAASRRAPTSSRTRPAAERAGAAVVLAPDDVTGDAVAAAAAARALGAGVRGGGSRDRRRIRRDGDTRRGCCGSRGARGRSLVWPRVCPRPHRARRRRAGGGRRRGRRRRGGPHRRGGRSAGGGRAAAAAAQGLPAARALLRYPRRRRGRRAQTCAPSSSRRASGSRRRRSSPATTRSRRSSAPPSRPGRRARTGSSSSARSTRAARWCSSTSASPASGPAPAARCPRGGRPATSSPTRRTPCAPTICSIARDFAPGLPGFIVSFDYRIEGETPAEQLQLLAADRTLRGRLLHGIALQGLGRPVSARRAFGEALELAPNDVDALVADAVGRYDKGNPSAAFSRLGPLSRRFPEAATVRFHLGLLLLWQKDLREATRQLELARKAEPGSRIAAEATRFLDAVRNAGTS